MTTPFVQQLFDDFSDVTVNFVGRADRTTLQSTLFDVPKRTEVTLPCFTRILPGFYRRVSEFTSPEELGERTRILAGRPNPLHFNGAHWQTLIERERRLLLDLPPLPPEETEWMLDWTGRALRAQRQDDGAFPCSRVGWHIRLVDNDVLEPLLEQVKPWPPDELRRLRRLSASLELYGFVLHGEHRDGIFDHGPYDLGKGRIALVKDFTDLQSTWLPWSVPEVRLPYPAVSLVMVLDDVCAPRINWVGTTEFEAEPWEHLQAVGAFAVSDGHATWLEPDEWDAIERAAREAQKKLFAAMVRWPDDEKVTYGMWLFSNHLHETPEFLGLDPAINAEMAGTFEQCVAEQYAQLDVSKPSPVWAALRREVPFTPLEVSAT